MEKNNEELIILDVEMPDNNVPVQQSTKDAKSKFSRESDIILDSSSSIVKSLMTPEEVRQAVELASQNEVVDEKDEK